jgi:hypothetical protein
MARTRHFENLFSITELEKITGIFAAPVQLASKPTRRNEMSERKYRLTWKKRDGSTATGEIISHNKSHMQKLADNLNKVGIGTDYKVEIVSGFKRDKGDFKNV